jgi:glycosyltransferase involved in cell wall biosynthesis
MTTEETFILPKISVVTVNFNMAGEIGDTLDSVLAQDYPSFESIVIDGGSADGSCAIIESYTPRLAYWISENDRNLYDGMNKGVAAATGEWVLFMNSGDRFASSNVLSKMFAEPHDEADVLCGHHIRHYSEQGIDRLILAEPPAVLPLRMNCSHQALFMRREVLAAHPFVLDRLTADYETIISAYAAGKQFKLINCVVAKVSTGGRSDVYRIRSLMERIRLVRRHGLMTIPIALHYAVQVLRAAVVPSLKRLLPKQFLSHVLRRRRIDGLG